MYVCMCIYMYDINKHTCMHIQCHACMQAYMTHYYAGTPSTIAKRDLLRGMETSLGEPMIHSCMFTDNYNLTAPYQLVLEHNSQSLLWGGVTTEFFSSYAFTASLTAMNNWWDCWIWSKNWSGSFLLTLNQFTERVTSSNIRKIMRSDAAAIYFSVRFGAVSIWERCLFESGVYELREFSSMTNDLFFAQNNRVR